MSVLTTGHYNLTMARNLKLIEITLSPFGDFKAQLSSAQNTGLLSLGQRLEFLVPNQNPYWTGFKGFLLGLKANLERTAFPADAG
jgi:hypothetical protein